MAKTIEITELDLKNIKSNIISYMKKDETFKDYDFEASGLNTLIDILAVNTHHNSYYMNMLTNEMFLDTARIRENVVSKAKLLNYTPRSAKSAIAQVSLELLDKNVYATADVYDTIKINRGLQFTTNYNGKKYSFVPNVTRIVEKNTAIQNDNGTFTNVYKIDDLEIIQGIEVQEEFVVDNTDPNQRFYLSNDMADISTLQVFVQPDSEDDLLIEYKKSTDNLRLESTSEVYFIQESKNGWELFFGDGVLGSELLSGNTLIVKYLVTAGSEANGIAQFTIGGNSDRDLFKVSNLTVTGVASGGAEKEDIASIKFNAPRNFEGQRRAVTIRDYKSIIPQIYPSASSVNVWGGEDNEPQTFGRVFMAIRPNNGYYLSDFEKSTIKSILRKEYSIVSILPDIVDPEYTRIRINSTIKWDNESTIFTADELKSKVLTAIKDFSAKNLNEFDSYFRYSNLVHQIDMSDRSITNNVTKINMINDKSIILSSAAPYKFSFNNQIKKGTLKSVGIQVAGSQNYWYVEENSTYDGTLNFYSFDLNNKKIYTENIKGSINYISGLVNIQDIIINSVESGTSNNFRMEAEPVSFDIFPKRNQILLIDPNDVSISMDADSEEYNNNYDITSQNVQIIRR
jgi:hypothetical protein